MSTELTAPFQLTASGAVQATTDPNTQVRQHVDALIGTTPGERVMNPTYGVNLEALVFASNDSTVASTVSNDVAQALAQWEPAINVQSVSPSPSSDPLEGVALVNVNYTLGAASASGSAVSTASILVGGTVIED